MLDSVIEFVSSDLKSIGAVAAIVVVGFIVFLVLRRGLSILASRGALADSLVRLLRIILRWTMVAVISLLVLQEVGVLENVWSALLAMMAMVAIGFFAVWSILSNVLSTLLILVYRPFRIADDVRIPSESLAGRVVDINLIFTTLENQEKELIQIPNNMFFQKAIVRIPTGQKEISLYDQLVKLTRQ